MNAAYLKLHRSGELRERAARLRARLANCDLCPRRCGVDRLAGEKGFCHTGSGAAVASWCRHRGEEPAISGTRGSGTIFFGYCNLRCVYCQNFQISQPPPMHHYAEVGSAELASYMLELQRMGCHNINLVSPSHVVPQILAALSLAAEAGLTLPLVYNTNGYDAVDVIRALDGVVDIYLPDIKYATEYPAVKYSSARHYPEIAREVIEEMWQQVGTLWVDENGIARRGLIVRHLILPGNIAGTAENLAWLAKALSPEVTVSLMSQYYPVFHAGDYAGLSRMINAGEHEEALRFLEEAGLANGWVQNLEAPRNYQPDFDRPGHPFERSA